MRAIWSGVISFGLVNIPVGIYPATKENQVSFHLLHKKDCGRIKNQRVCSECGEVLDYDELVKGYEYEKGEYVSLTMDEIGKAQSENTDAIKIVKFVDVDEIDPIYFDSPYYIVPGKHGDKAYSLLRHTLEKSGKTGIATFVLRTKEYLAAVRVVGDALLLNTMHFAAEVREAEGIPAAGKIDEGEAKMALQLVDAMTEKFDIAQFKDHYNDALLELIEKKLEGKPIRAKKEEKQPTNVLDLMSRLKESLEKSAAEEAPATRRKSAPAAKAGPAKKATTARKTPVKTSAAATKSTAKPRPTKPHLKLAA